MTIVSRLLSTGILRANLFDELSGTNSNVGVSSTGTFYSTQMIEGTATELISSVPMRITNDKKLLVYDSFDELTYSIVYGTRLPIYGSNGGPYPPPGWTGLQNSSVDDGFLSISLPFTFYIAGSGYTTTYIGSNTYLTFGSGSTQFTGLSASNPPYPKFMFGAYDNSYQRVSTYTYGIDYVKIRYEGTRAFSGVVGSPTIVLEITVFNPINFGGNSVLELLVGTHNSLYGVANVASSSTAYATYTLIPNQSYVFQGNDNGTSWTIYTGYNVIY